MTVASILPFIVVCLIKVTVSSARNVGKRNWKN